MTKFSERNGFFFYTKVEERKLSRMSPVTRTESEYNLAGVEELDEACSETKLARQGSFLCSMYQSPNHDEIDKNNPSPEMIKWKVNIQKVIDSNKNGPSQQRPMSPRKSPQRKSVSCSSLQKRAV